MGSTSVIEGAAGHCNTNKETGRIHNSFRLKYHRVLIHTIVDIRGYYIDINLWMHQKSEFSRVRFSRGSKV